MEVVPRPSFRVFRGTGFSFSFYLEPSIRDSIMLEARISYAMRGRLPGRERRTVEVARRFVDSMTVEELGRFRYYEGWFFEL